MRPEQPEPDNNIPPPQFAGDRVIQPLSSEDDIRREALSNAPATVGNSDTQKQAEAAQDDPYPSTLITEPIRRPMGQPPNLHTSQATPTPETPKRKRRVLPIVGALLFVLLASAGYYYFFWNRVTVADLVEETTQNTTYLRPKQWQNLGLGTSSYGNMQGANGKSTAVVAITTAQSSVGNTSDATVKALRTLFLSTLTSATLKNNNISCVPDNDPQKEADTSSTPTTIGIFRLTATCKKDGGTFIMKMHGVLGYDGRVRIVLLLATTSDWNKSKEAFDKILNSVQQGSTV